MSLVFVLFVIGLSVWRSGKEEEKKQTPSDENQVPKVITKTIIMPDGSYGTETIVIDDKAAKSLKEA